jgi:hypothetical protein
MNPEAWVTLIVGIGTILMALASIAAIILSPIWALKIQRRLDAERELRERKIAVFRTLMSFRATRLSPHFVQALNLIDIEFTSDSERSVREAWKELQDHYNDWGRRTQDERIRDETFLLERGDDLLAELLVRMGLSLGYKFDKVQIRKGAYYPEGLGNIELEQQALRRGFMTVLSGNAALPVTVRTEQGPGAPLGAPA